MVDDEIYDGIDERIRAEDRFSYTGDDGLRVAIPDPSGSLTTQVYKRETLTNLKSYLIPDVRLTRQGHFSDHQSARPRDRVYLWWLAQLIHYGLGFQRTKDEAKAKLREAMLSVSLRVPQELIELEQRLKRLYKRHAREQGKYFAAGALPASGASMETAISLSHTEDETNNSSDDDTNSELSEAGPPNVTTRSLSKAKHTFRANESNTDEGGHFSDDQKSKKPEVYVDIPRRVVFHRSSSDEDTSSEDTDGDDDGSDTELPEFEKQTNVSELSIDGRQTDEEETSGAEADDENGNQETSDEESDHEMSESKPAGHVRRLSKPRVRQTSMIYAEPVRATQARKIATVDVQNNTTLSESKDSTNSIESTGSSETSSDTESDSDDSSSLTPESSDYEAEAAMKRSDPQIHVSQKSEPSPQGFKRVSPPHDSSSSSETSSGSSSSDCDDEGDEVADQRVSRQERPPPKFEVPHGALKRFQTNPRQKDSPMTDPFIEELASPTTRIVRPSRERAITAIQSQSSPTSSMPVLKSQTTKSAAKKRIFKTTSSQKPHTEAPRTNRSLNSQDGVAAASDMKRQTESHSRPERATPISTLEGGKQSSNSRKPLSPTPVTKPSPFKNRPSWSLSRKRGSTQNLGSEAKGSSLTMPAEQATRGPQISSVGAANTMPQNSVHSSLGSRGGNDVDGTEGRVATSSSDRKRKYGADDSQEPTEEPSKSKKGIFEMESSTERSLETFENFLLTPSRELQVNKVWQRPKQASAKRLKPCVPPHFVRNSGGDGSRRRV